MALFAKRDDIKQVPWFSLTEWHDVYRQIYSNDVIEQTKAYEALLVWKARMPKLPVGVDCTLSILQVCLRDREWTSKIDSGELPMYCENDLSLMYSTTIMRFLNHFCNIGHTKQTSLFQIAKQLKIPEWIVILRHQTAHGYELPSIGVLRIAINILLHWLHDEYWAAEARAVEKCYMEEANILEEEKEETKEVQAFTDLIELWTAVSLYIDAGYKLVSNLPEVQLREILQDLRAYMLSQYSGKTSDNDENEYISIHGKTIKIDKEYNLRAAQTLLLSEISMHLAENKSLITIHKKSDIICNVLLKNEAFLPNSDVVQIFQQKGRKNIDLKKKILPPDTLLSYQWVECPIGLLPWQMDSLKSLEPLKLNPSKHSVSILDSQIIAGIINRKSLKMQSRIKWENVLRKKRRTTRQERKRDKSIADVIMNRALEIARKTDTM
ncbi:las1-like protein [Lasius niger]|uniref:Las1-like protein n=1 Tax=Lasius niger TaxID=67767 RepID=A0A0J7KQM8_LASNI|nr:las1-like protein [Lasius niger]